MASLEQAPGDSGKEKNTFLTGRNLHKTRLREEQASATTLWRGVVCGTAAYPLLGWERLVPSRCLHPFQLPGGGPPPAYSPAQPEMEVGVPEGPAQLKMEVEEAAAGCADGPQTHLVTSAVEYTGGPLN